LRPYERNPREHSQAQIEQIAASMTEWGWTVPILVDENGMILAGVGRYKAAQLRGVPDAPVIVTRGWTLEQKRAYVIADNKLNENSHWDESLLSLELEDLMKLGVDPALMGMSEGDLKTSDGNDEALAVHEIAVDQVQDQFWLSVRGPLAQQADAIARIEAVMKELPGVTVDMGTMALE
jgi:ParB-like chromosome segregation protein Spo0J